jgi:hypothetical protein
MGSNHKELVWRDRTELSNLEGTNQYEVQARKGHTKGDRWAALKTHKSQWSLIHSGGYRCWSPRSVSVVHLFSEVNTCRTQLGAGTDGAETWEHLLAAGIWIRIAVIGHLSCPKHATESHPVPMHPRGWTSREEHRHGPQTTGISPTQVKRPDDSKRSSENRIRHTAKHYTLFSEWTTLIQHWNTQFEAFKIRPRARENIVTI